MSGSKAVVIVITWSDRFQSYKCEGCVYPKFAAAVGATPGQALHRWRKELNYWGEVKR